VSGKAHEANRAPKDAEAEVIRGNYLMLLSRIQWDRHQPKRQKLPESPICGHSPACPIRELRNFADIPGTVGTSRKR